MKKVTLLILVMMMMVTLSSAIESKKSWNKQEKSELSITSDENQLKTGDSHNYRFRYNTRSKYQKGEGNSFEKVSRSARSVHSKKNNRK